MMRAPFAATLFLAVALSAASCNSSGGGAACTTPLSAGFTSLHDMPVRAWCFEGHDVQEWTTPCQGSQIVLVSAADCATYYLFDPGSGDLQAVGGACNVPGTRCDQAAPGFVFPSSCFDVGYDAGAVQDLCAGDAGTE